ncbi:MAG: 3'-5' exonuclease [Candidatus Aenigmatarchaeota archaeon]
MVVGRFKAGFVCGSNPFRPTTFIKFWIQMENMIVIDIETTGKDPKKCSIVSIGAVNFCNPDEVFYGECRMEEDKEVTQEALEITGFTLEQIKDPSKPPVKELLYEFYNWSRQFKNRTLASMNPQALDWPILIEAFERYGIEWLYGHRAVDLHSQVYAEFLKLGIPVPLKGNVSALSSSHIFQLFGLPEEPKPHHALIGAIWTTEAFYRLLLGEPVILSEYPFRSPFLASQFHKIIRYI